MFELDYNAAEYCRLSNDAFYNIMYGEDVLDEQHLAEVNELRAKHLLGFEIDTDSWDELDGEYAGFIECTVVPYKASEYSYTHQAKLINNWVVLIAPNKDWTSAHIKRINTVTGEEYGEEDVEPFINKHGLLQIEYGKPNKSGMRSCFYKKHITTL